MEYYRFGCCTGGLVAPGNNLLIGLMSDLNMPARCLPDQLMLVEGHMPAGTMYASAVHTCEFLVHIITGSVLVSVDGEEVMLMADNTVRIPPGMQYQFSTRRTLGMTALVIIPLQGDTSGPGDHDAMSVCTASGMPINGDPQPMAMSSLAILHSFCPLTSDGCSLPMVQMVRGKFNRDTIFASLLPRYSADPMALRAFTWACNAHPGASWWHNRRDAQGSIVKEVAQLVTR